MLSASAVAGASAAPPGHFRGIVTAHTAAGSALRASRAVPRSGVNNLLYNGGPVMHSDANYAIYWEPSGYSTSSTYKSIVNGYFSNVGSASGATTNVYALTTQYYDGSGNIAYSASTGPSIVDTDPYPASGCTASVPCLTDAQLQTELSHVISTHALPTGLSTLYFIYTPAGVATCFSSAGTDCSSGGPRFDYCAYHSNIGNGTSAVLYAVMPYAGVSGCSSGEYPNGDAGADSGLNVTSHENIEAITDPLGSAWFDSSGNEIGDKCAWTFGSQLGGSAGSEYNQSIASGSYWLQEEWSNATSSCVQRMSGGGSSTPVASFTFSPSSPTAGQSVSFNASGSTDTGATITGYAWTFGDGSTGSGVTASHPYSAAGTYTVRLTVTDSLGHSSSTTHSVTVASGSSNPVASFTFSPSSPTVKRSVSFNASGSTDTGATITGYAWTFGDGSTGSGRTVSHLYSSAGTYSVTLTVTDRLGHTASKTLAITVRLH